MIILTDKIHSIIAKQKQYFNNGHTLNIENRIKALKNLKK